MYLRYSASYNVNSQMVKIKVEEYKQIDGVRKTKMHMQVVKNKNVIKVNVRRRQALHLPPLWQLFRLLTILPRNLQNARVV